MLRLLVVALAVVAGVAAIGVLASRRYGVAGRRITAVLVVMFVVAVSMPSLMSPQVNSPEAQAITSLRAINAAQLVYSTSVGMGRYADRLDILARQSSEQRLAEALATLSLRYRIELIHDSSHYTVIAIPIGESSVPRRAFCVTETSTIYWSDSATSPAIEAGRCPPSWSPIR